MKSEIAMELGKLLGRMSPNGVAKVGIILSGITLLATAATVIIKIDLAPKK